MVGSGGSTKKKKKRKKTPFNFSYNFSLFLVLDLYCTLTCFNRPIFIYEVFLPLSNQGTPRIQQSRLAKCTLDSLGKPNQQLCFRANSIPVHLQPISIIEAKNDDEWRGGKSFGPSSTTDPAPTIKRNGISARGKCRRRDQSTPTT